MTLILADISSLCQHIETLSSDPERYRPEHCIHCSGRTLWHHGYYYRQPDRPRSSEKVISDVPIPRFQCAACRTTCSVLPECIPPRRWYLWAIQQRCLLMHLLGQSVRRVAQSIHIPRRTLSRWINRLKAQFVSQHQTLCVTHPTMGYHIRFSSFWRQWCQQYSLSQAMWLLNRHGLCIP